MTHANATIVIADRYDSEWLGGGRFFKRHGLYSEVDSSGAYVAAAAAVRAAAGSLEGPVFFSMERLGWAACGADWALVTRGRELSALSALAKRYDVVLTSSRTMPRGSRQLPRGVGRILSWVVEPPPFQNWQRALEQLTSPMRISTWCIVSVTQTCQCQAHPNVICSVRAFLNGQRALK